VDIDDVEAFLVLSEELHMERAARRLHTTRSSLSRHVRLLERSLGVSLLDRSARHVRLTAAGLTFVRQSQSVLRTVRQLRESTREAEVAPEHPLRVGCSELMGPREFEVVASWLKGVHPTYPPEMRCGPSEVLIKAVVHGNLDVAVVFTSLHISVAQSARICDVPVVALLPRGHGRDDSGAVAVWTVLETGIVAPGTNLAELRLMLSEIARSAEIAWVAAVEIDDYRCVVPAVSSGLGPTLVPLSLIASLAEANVVIRRLADPPLQMMLVVTWRDQQVVGRLVRRLIKSLRRHFEICLSNAFAEL
jgi:DNA-binding transcriptional LysR family regulator